MTRTELRAKFREENPEITDRVITDAVLDSWMETANEEVGCATLCIVTSGSETFNSVINAQSYDLESNITNFLEIDDMPGGGVYYDDLPLIKSSAGEMNSLRKTWKTSDSGTPKRYWRRGKYLWFDRAPDAVAEIAVDCVLIPDAFNADGDEPFNGLGHLQCFSDAISKYLQYRAKNKVGKYEEGTVAKRDYMEYITWMKKRVKGGKFGPISLRPA